MIAAVDKKPELSSVTLVAVTSVSLDATVSAMERSLAEAQFARALLLSDRRPDRLGPSIEWREIPPISSRRSYSRFMLQELASWIETDFALCIQWDSFILDGANWRSEFLEFDYIGAPWPHFGDQYRVGNGGFSLRSRKLLQACTKLPATVEAEDVAICRTYRPWLEEAHNIRFATESAARAFSYERMPPTGAEFGFHGVFNMRQVLGDTAFADLLASLDPGSLGRLESRELFRQAIADLDFRSAWLTLRNRAVLR